jgi:predicted anti-sigma-YlaC factor YlaD
VDDPVPPTPPHNGDAASTFDLPVDEVTCEEFVELVTEYFEGALQARTLCRVEEHLVMCDWCVAYVEQMRATIGALRELREERSPEPPASVLAAVRARNAGGA